MSELISLREFARRLKIGEKTIRDGVRSGRISKGVISVDGKPQIDYETALEEVANSGLGQKSIIAKKKSLKSDDSENDSSTSDINDCDIPALGVSIKRKEYWISRIRESEAKKIEGELVRKDIVYSQLYEFGKQMQNNLLSIPDRITDSILHEQNRDKVHRTIYDAIWTVLNKLSELKNYNFQDEQNI